MVSMLCYGCSFKEIPSTSEMRLQSAASQIVAARAKSEQSEVCRDVEDHIVASIHARVAALATKVGVEYRGYIRDKGIHEYYMYVTLQGFERKDMHLAERCIRQALADAGLRVASLDSEHESTTSKGGRSWFVAVLERMVALEGSLSFHSQPSD